MTLDWIDDLDSLHALYGEPGEASLVKVSDRLTPHYRKWIMASRFCVLTTVGPEGTDGSPRGDEGPVVTELDERTLAMPDWRGNDRIDSLRNIVRDGRVSLMFMVTGSNNVVRVNGNARITADPELAERLGRGGKRPRAVIVIRIGEVYFQCARAIVRARLWSSGGESPQVPSAGDFLKEGKQDFDGASYDADWPERAAAALW